MPRSSLLPADLNQPLEFQSRFDHVICMSVMQTLTSPGSALSEFYQVLKPGGTLVLSLPKQNSMVVSQSMGKLIQYRIKHLERRTPGKALLVILKSLADRHCSTVRWTIPQARQMTIDSGFKIDSLEEGRQISVVAEKAVV